MPQQDTDGLDTDAERAIVARLIENTPQVVTYKQLRAATPQLTPERRDAAVASLKRSRVLLVQRDGVRATAPLRRLGALRMVVF